MKRWESYKRNKKESKERCGKMIEMINLSAAENQKTMKTTLLYRDLNGHWLIWCALMRSISLGNHSLNVPVSCKTVFVRRQRMLQVQTKKMSSENERQNFMSTVFRHSAEQSLLSDSSRLPQSSFQYFLFEIF